MMTGASRITTATSWEIGWTPPPKDSSYPGFFTGVPVTITGRVRVDFALEEDASAGGGPVRKSLGAVAGGEEHGG